MDRNVGRLALLLYCGCAICGAQSQAGQSEAGKTSAVDARGNRVYLDPKCGFKFTYRRIWTVTTERLPKSTDACEYRIIFQGRASKGPLIRHHVDISVSDHQFDGLEKEENLKFEDGVWYQERGIAGNAMGHAIRGINWVGLNMPQGPARCFGTEGYEGMGDRPTATLFGVTLKRIAELDGGECENADTDGIELLLPTFEFIPIKTGGLPPPPSGQKA